MRERYLEKRIEAETQALIEFSRNGGYSLACDICGADQSRIFIQYVRNNQGQVVVEKKGRVCDPCSENGLANVMIEGEK